MKNETVKTGMKIGATAGGLVFLVFGVMQGFYFGAHDGAGAGRRA